jgi:hypothetical protein
MKGHGSRNRRAAPYAHHHVPRPSERPKLMDHLPKAISFEDLGRLDGRTCAADVGDWGSSAMFEARRCAPYSAGAPVGSATDSCGCAAASAGASRIATSLLFLAPARSHSTPSACRKPAQALTEAPVG